MEKKIASRKKLRCKFKHFATALAGVAIMTGTTLHGIPLARASATGSPSTSPPITIEQTTLINKDDPQPIVATDPSVNEPLANQSQGDQSTKDRLVKRDQNKDKRHDELKQHDKRQMDENRKFNHREEFAQRLESYNNSLNQTQINNSTANPVDIVMSAATAIGFDANNDTFTLMSQSDSQSIVKVVHNGNNYTVTVDHLSNGNWTISSVNQI